MTAKKGIKEHYAIEAIMAASKLFGVRFDISYQYKKIVTRYHQKWVVKVMDKIFYDSDFVKVVRQAIVFCKEAHTTKNI